MVASFLLRLQQRHRAVGGVSEGVVDRRVDARLLQRELEAGPVARTNGPRLEPEELIARVGIDADPVEDRADDVEGAVGIWPRVDEEDPDRRASLHRDRVL